MLGVFFQIGVPHPYRTVCLFRPCSLVSHGTPSQSLSCRISLWVQSLPFLTLLFCLPSGLVILSAYLALVKRVLRSLPLPKEAGPLSGYYSRSPNVKSGLSTGLSLFCSLSTDHPLEAVSLFLSGHWGQLWFVSVTSSSRLVPALGCWCLQLFLSTILFCLLSMRLS